MKQFTLFQRLKLMQSFKKANNEQLNEIIQLATKELRLRKQRVKS